MMEALKLKVDESGTKVESMAVMIPKKVYYEWCESAKIIYP